MRSTVGSGMASSTGRPLPLPGADSGGAMSQVTVTRHPQRIGRLVLTNCDTHENFPPGMFKAMPPLAKLPGGIAVLSAPFRIGPVARAAFRPFARDPLPPELIASWMEPARKDRDVMRDLKKVTIGMDKRYTLEAAENLRRSQLPILLTWAPGDRYFPIRYAERLERETGNAHLVEIPGAKTFVPVDEPQRLAEEIAEFAATPS